MESYKINHIEYNSVIAYFNSNNDNRTITISKKLKITEGTARTRLSRAMMLKINSLSEKISFVTTLSFSLQV